MDWLFNPGKLFDLFLNWIATGIISGLSFQQIAAMMSGVTQPEYAEMMLKGGRSIEGNRSKKERR